MHVKKQQHYIKNFFLSLALAFILLLVSDRTLRVNAATLRLTVGGRFENSGTVAHYVLQSNLQALPDVSATQQLDAAPVVANIEIIANEVHQSGVIASPNGELSIVAQKKIILEGASVARDAVHLETPGHLSFGKRSVTGVRGDRQPSEKLPAVDAIAAFIEGNGAVVGDLNDEPVRASQIKSTAGTIALSPETVERSHTKRLWNRRKKTRKTVEQIPFVFRGPVQLSGPEDVLLTAVQFNALPHQVSSVSAGQKVLLQGAKGSIYTAKSQIGGRASVFQEYCVPSTVDHHFYVSARHNIILNGFVPSLHLSLEASEGTIRWSAMPVYSRTRSTGFGVGTELSALAGTVQSYTDFTSWLLRDKRLPKVDVSFTIPLKPFVKQLANPDQPDWAKVVNTYGAYKDAHAVYRDVQQWKESLTALKIGGRFSYTSSSTELVDYAAGHIPPLAYLKMNGRHIELNAINIQSEYVDISAKTLSLNSVFARVSRTIKSHAFSAGVSLGVTAPLYVSASIFRSKCYHTFWLPSTLVAQNLLLKVDRLNVIHSRVVGVQGTLDYRSIHLSENQNQYRRHAYTASASSSGMVHLGLANERHKASSYRSEVRLIEKSLAIQSKPSSQYEHKHAVALDLRPFDLFHDLNGGFNRVTQQTDQTITQDKMPKRYTKSLTINNALRDEEFVYPENTEPQNHPDAIVKGVKTGLAHLLEMLMHPLDELLYPASLLAYDSIVCLTVSEEDDAIRVAPARPAAIARMKERWGGLKYTIQDFQTASPLKKTERASALATTLVVPGQVFKAVFRLGQVAGDLHRFRVVNPQKFQTREWSDLAIVPPRVKYVTASEVKDILRTKDLLYVVLPGGKLLLAHEHLPTAVLTRSGLKSRLLAHPELATFQPVVAAGIVQVKKGRILEVNDASGHFRPHGDHLPSLVRRVFARHGLFIRSQYQVRYGAPHPGLAFTRVIEPPKPPSNMGKELRRGLPFFTHEINQGSSHSTFDVTNSAEEDTCKPNW